MSQCWWVYLLICRDGRTYTGVAIDVAARFAAHSSGKGAKFTRSNPPVRVLGTRAYGSKSDAFKAEAALKKLPRPQKLAWAQATHKENSWPISQDVAGPAPEPSCSG